MHEMTAHLLAVRVKNILYWFKECGRRLGNVSVSNVLGTGRQGPVWNPYNPCKTKQNKKRHGNLPPLSKQCASREIPGACQFRQFIWVSKLQVLWETYSQKMWLSNWGSYLIPTSGLYTHIHTCTHMHRYTNTHRINLLHGVLYR